MYRVCVCIHLRCIALCSLFLYSAFKRNTGKICLPCPLTSEKRRQGDGRATRDVRERGKSPFLVKTNCRVDGCRVSRRFKSRKGFAAAQAHCYHIADGFCWVIERKVNRVVEQHNRRRIERERRESEEENPSSPSRTHCFQSSVTGSSHNRLTSDCPMFVGSH